MSQDSDMHVDDHSFGDSSVVKSIESMLEIIADALLAEEDLVITLARRPRSFPVDHHGDVPKAIYHIKFPGGTAEEAWRFTVYLRLLELIHEAVMTGNVVTKRHLYYEDPKLFGRQSVVDACVDNLAYTFGVPRRSLCVAAAAKGLACGAFHITRVDGNTTDGLSQESMLVYGPSSDDLMDVDAAEWILVVEKEAVFRSLASAEAWRQSLSQGIMITAKGYPDLATRALLRRFAGAPSRAAGGLLPCFGLVDYDPDGLAILLTYKHGSQQMPHENGALRVPNIQWLGPTSADIQCSDDEHKSQVLLPLSGRDRRMAVKMLAWPHLAEDVSEAEFRRELQMMLMLNVKFELQMLDLLPGGFLGWLQMKMKRVLGQMAQAMPCEDANRASQQ